MGAYESIVSTIIMGLSQDSVTDPVVKSITEEEVGVLLDEMLTSCGVTPTNIPPNKILWIRLKVMEQLYWKLALASAPLYAITIDGLSVKKETRFEHYMKLIDAIAKNLAAMESGDPTLGGAVLKSYDTYVDKPYNHNSYITAQNIPVVEVILDSFDERFNKVSLDLRQCKSKFLKYRVYCSDSQIIDEYDGYSVSENAELFLDECNIHHNKLKIPVEYSNIACVVTLKGGLTTYHELVIGEPIPDVPTENPGVDEDVPGEGEGLENSGGEADVTV